MATAKPKTDAASALPAFEAALEQGFIGAVPEPGPDAKPVLDASGNVVPTPSATVKAPAAPQLVATEEPAPSE